MSNGSILLADDDQDMVDSLSRWFRRKGYQTTPTYHPMQSLIAVANNRYDVAVIDIGLPDTNGLELLEELVELDLFPVIVLTGRSNPESEIEAYKRGAYKYMIKPVSMDRIEDAVREALLQKVGVSVPTDDGPNVGSRPEGFADVQF